MKEYRGEIKSNNFLKRMRIGARAAERDFRIPGARGRATLQWGKGASSCRGDNRLGRAGGSFALCAHAHAPWQRARLYARSRGPAITMGPRARARVNGVLRFNRIARGFRVCWRRSFWVTSAVSGFFFLKEGAFLWLLWNFGEPNHMSSCDHHARRLWRS